MTKRMTIGEFTGRRIMARKVVCLTWVTNGCRNSTERVRAIVDSFIRSEYMQAWTESAISSDYSIDGRFARCQDAAEHGCDGSTHAEVIEDWRDAFKAWLRDNAHGGTDSFNRGDRLSAAVMAHFDAVEAWHIAHGSIEEEIG